MSADLKRLRGNQEDASPGPSKRRALGQATSGEDHEDGVEDWWKVVETKRKEAIFRQMLEYKRSYAREAAKARELEEQKKTLEASVQGVEICWAQLVSVIRNLAGQQLDDKAEEGALQPSLDLSLPSEKLQSALQTRLPPTQKLVQRFVDLASQNGTRPAGNAELQTKCVQHQTEVSALKSSSSMLQTQLSSIAKARDDALRALQIAEKSLDRQRMEHDKAQRAWMEQKAQIPLENGTNGGSGHATPNGKVEEDVKPLVNGVGGASPGILLPDTLNLEELARSRLEQLESLRVEQSSLSQENDRLRHLANHPTETMLRDSPFFQVYLHQLSMHVTRAESLRLRCETAEKTLDALRDSNFEFREAVLAEAKTESEALRSQVAKRDSDTARLRGQRDEMNSELLERRAREGDRMKFADEMESLAKARQERINLLSSEVRRLKGKLGAEHGSRGYLDFLSAEGGVEGDYVKNMEEQMKAARTEIVALKAQISSDDTSSAIIELEKVTKSLAEYEAVYGPNVTVSADIKSLSDRLESSSKDKSVLELKLEEAEAATNALYTEVEGLSKSWESLEGQVRSKVWELKDGELKMSRLTTEKAKADNKYFAAMRAKEAVDAECKAAQRSVDKQLKLLERAQEVERGLNAQLAAHEKGITALKDSALELQSRLGVVTSEKVQLELRLQQSQAALADSQQVTAQRVAESVSDKEARQRALDDLDTANRTIKKMKEKQESMNASSEMSAGEWQMKEERDKLLKILRCSCCEQNFKQQVIVKCMHTFCKNCLDQRIISRQRKCPACGLAFAKEEVQTLYWQ